MLRPKAEKMVVTLAPGDLLVFCKERGRQTWSLPRARAIEASFRAAAHRQTARAAAEKKLRRKHV